MIMSYYRMMMTFCAATLDDKMLDTVCVPVKGEVVPVHCMKA